MAEEIPEVSRIEEDELKATSADELIAKSDLTPDDVARAEEVANESAKGRPLVTLTKYQKLIVTVAKRFVAFMICRQGGKTFGSTLRVARKVLAHVQNYNILSRSERQSGNAIAQTAAHLRAVEKALRSKGKRIGKTPGYSSQRLRYHRTDGSAFEYTRLTIALPNGARVIGLPASPDTVVGISGSVYADEFALHKDSREIYGRLFPVVSRRPEYEFLVTSTPRGTAGKFYDIMTGEDYADIFFRLIVDIFEAVKQGLVLYDYNGDAITDDAGIERLRKALKDTDKWAEEYLVQFVNDVLTLLSHELIGRCERMHTPDGKPYEILFRDLEDGFDPTRENLARQLLGRLDGAGELFLGHDIARTKDLSVIWIDQEREGELWQRGLVIMRKKDFETQEAVLWQFLDLPQVRKAGIDATGLGARTAERAATRYGGKVVPINFASRLLAKSGESFAAKVLLARTILERHQDGTDHYPVLDLIRDDFHQVKRKRGASPDTFTYFADDGETGHADIFTSKALADVVFQELREFGGSVAGMRIAAPAADGFSDEKKQRPDFTREDAPRHEDPLGVLASGNLEAL